MEEMRRAYPTGHQDMVPLLSSLVGLYEATGRTQDKERLLAEAKALMWVDGRMRFSRPPNPRPKPSVSTRGGASQLGNGGEDDIDRLVAEIEGVGVAEQSKPGRKDKDKDKKKMKKKQKGKRRGSSGSGRAVLATVAEEEGPEREQPQGSTDSGKEGARVGVDMGGSERKDRGQS